MRSVVQGVDLRASWDRYLQIEGKATDLRVVRSTIAWIRDEFAAAARREDRFGIARLVLIDVTRIAEPVVALPTLEEFAEAHGMHHDSEAEQIEAYEAAYGTPSARQKRRGRLIARQLEALRWLEGLIAQPPRAGDAVASWLHPSLANHLEAADVLTVEQLVDRINGLGRHWFSGIKAMGDGKARRIVEWLKAHQETIGLALGPHVERPRGQLHSHELAAVVAPASDIRPIEKFIVPSELDGSHGLFRRPRAQCRMSADTDDQAILAWLRSKQGLTPDQKAHQAARRKQPRTNVGPEPDWLQTLSHTQRAYRKETERFLLWAVIDQGKALSSMTGEDCAAYRDFLADPQPRSRWCGERSRERWSPLWRPFEGPLSPSAQRHAIGILRNFHGFLVDQGYLTANPWAGVKSTRSAATAAAARSFSAAQWNFIEEQLRRSGSHSTDQRLKLALHLLYATGLRLSEVVAAKVGDMKRVARPACTADTADAAPTDGWILGVSGTRGRFREVPVPTDVVSELSSYLDSRGLGIGGDDARSAAAFLLGKASDFARRAPGLAERAKGYRATEGIAAHTLYDQLKAFFAGCAETLSGQGDAPGCDRFRAASTHWLRHTHASHAIAGGMSIQAAQHHLGHASLATTAVYAAREPTRRTKAAHPLSSKRSPA